MTDEARVASSRDEMVNCQGLRIAEDNPNEMTKQQFEALKESIRQYGILQPPVVDEQTMIVIDGNHRVAAAKELGMSMIKVVLVRLNNLTDRPTISWAKYHPDYEVAAYGGEGAKGKPKKKETTYKEDSQLIAFSGNGAKPNQARWYAKYDQTTTWQEKPDNSMAYDHPTQKPVVLAERALLNSSTEGEICLDNFAGSGFSLIACHKLKRIWRGIELEPSYCDVISQRFEHYSGIKAVLTRNGKEVKF